MKKKGDKLTRSESRHISKNFGNRNGQVIPVALKHKYALSAHAVRSVNVTPNGRYLIITNTTNPIIRVVDLELLKYHLPHKYLGHSDTVRLTSITPDSKFFYTASWDASVRKYELKTGKCLETYTGIGRAPSVFVDPGGKYLFAASYDSDIDISLKNTGRCWNISTKELVNLYPHKNARVEPECIDIVYDEEYVYTGGDDGVISKYSLLSKKPVMEYFNKNGVVIRKLAVSENYLAAACADGKVRVFHKQTGKHYKTFVHNAVTEVLDVRISKDESRLFSCASDGSLSCVDLSSFDSIFYKMVHRAWIWTMTLARDDSMIITGSCDGSVAFVNGAGDVLTRLFNLVDNDNILFSCPPDALFTNGCFYTKNTNLVMVYDKNGKEYQNLPFTDKRRIEYLDQLNLKDIIIAKLGNNSSYTNMIENLLQQKNDLNALNGFIPPRLLGS
jgi:WD40 repeat protein